MRSMLKKIVLIIMFYVSLNYDVKSTPSRVNSILHMRKLLMEFEDIFSVIKM